MARIAKRLKFSGGELMCWLARVAQIEALLTSDSWDRMAALKSLRDSEPTVSAFYEGLEQALQVSDAAFESRRLERAIDEIYY